MSHLGNANKMVSDTPRTTDRMVFIDGNPWVNAPFARGLERELNAANTKIKRLEEAGDALKKSRSCGCQNGDSIFYCITCISAWDAWLKSKEAKP